MEIIIGREEGARRLHCMVDGREFNIGPAGMVPLSVSRKHCRITINSGHINIENLNLQNETYVDGNQVFSKALTVSSRVQLGKDRFLLPLRQILQLVNGVSAPMDGQPAKEVPTFSLRPLKAVWSEYEQQVLDIQNKVSQKANQQRLQGILSLLGVCVGLIPGINVAVRVVIVLGALLLAVYFFCRGKTRTAWRNKFTTLTKNMPRNTSVRTPNVASLSETYPIAT